MSSPHSRATERTIAGLPSGVAFFFLPLFSAAAVIYGVAWSDSMIIAPDTPGYFETARDLTDFRLEQLHDRPPGYPLLLLLTGASSQPTRSLFFTSLLLHLITVWMLSITLHQLGSSGFRLKLFGFIMILPPYVQSSATIMSENLAQFCLALIVAVLVLWFRNQRTIYLMIASLAIGFCALTRPTYQALSPAIIVCILPLAGYLGFANRRDMLKAAASLVLFSALLIGGFSAYNYARFGYFVVTPLLGYNLSTKTVLIWDKMDDVEDGAVKKIMVRIRDEELTAPGSSHTGLQSIHAARDEIIRSTGMSQIDAARYLVRLNLKLIMRAPLHYLQEVGRSLGGWYWFPAGNQLANMNSRIIQLIWSLLHFTIIGCFFMTALVISGAVADGFLKSRLLKLKPRSPLQSATKYQLIAYCLAGTVVFYTMVISCAIDTGSSRHRLPTDCLILMMTFLAPMLWLRMASGTVADRQQIRRRIA